MTTVLVIDDELALRTLITDALKSADFNVLSAPNGRLGVQVARECHPDLVICDVNMPELDGYGVLTALREDNATALIPFVFLTGKKEAADIRQGMNRGADDYLTKPFQIQELLSAVRARLGKHALLTRQTQQRLEDLRQSITHSLPHELRTPLALVKGYSSILAEDYAHTDTQVSQIAQIISDSADRLHRLTEKFWTYAEIEILAEHPNVREGWSKNRLLNPEVVITEKSQSMAAKAGREQDLVIGVSEAEIHISEKHLGIIVRELIENACKFSKAGTPVYVLGVADDNEFCLQITDRGRGMTAQQIENIGAYMQFERPRHEQPGTGLGLIIAKRLTELYGGSLRIQSVPDQETTIIVTFACQPKQMISSLSVS